jgi:hypothetical protein
MADDKSKLAVEEMVRVWASAVDSHLQAFLDCAAKNDVAGTGLACARMAQVGNMLSYYFKQAAEELLHGPTMERAAKEAISSTSKVLADKLEQARLGIVSANREAKTPSFPGGNNSLN